MCWVLVAACVCGATGGPATTVTLVGDSAGVPPLAMHSHKAKSVASFTSQCSFSSTIVHVGDKKPPESGGKDNMAATLVSWPGL